MNIALIGYGKMGKEIEALAPTRHIAIKQIFTLENNPRATGISKQSLKDVDVCVDFSVPTAVIQNVTSIAECGKNIVIGTTGWYDQLEAVKKIAAQNNIGVLYSSNFSLGMNIFFQVLTSASHLFDKFDSYDVSVNEVHHKHKIDSPSGTALALGQIILQNIRRKKTVLSETSRNEIKPEQLHITSARLGEVVGTHNVKFDSDADSIELIHTAKNRSGFALGSLIAAEWLNGKQGFFTMNDVLTSL